VKQIEIIQGDCMEELPKNIPQTARERASLAEAALRLAQGDEVNKADWTSFDGRITLLQGDCMERLVEIQAGTVQCVVTSPPY
jgi:hypothetical protein